MLDTCLFAEKFQDSARAFDGTGWGLIRNSILVDLSVDEQETFAVGHVDRPSQTICTVYGGSINSQVFILRRWYSAQHYRKR